MIACSGARCRPTSPASAADSRPAGRRRRRARAMPPRRARSASAARSGPTARRSRARSDRALVSHAPSVRESSGAGRRARSAARAAAQALAQRQVRVAQQGARRDAAAVARRGRITSRRRVRREHRDVQSRLQLDHRLAAEPRQQRAVGGAAAQEHVLAVVDARARRGDRVRRAAKARAHLNERDLGSRRPRNRARRRCRQPRRPRRRRSPADPARLRAATASWWRSTAHAALENRLRFSRDALEQAPVDAAHRQHACGAATVDHRRQLQAAGVPLAWRRAGASRRSPAARSWRRWAARSGRGPRAGR